MKEKIEKLEGRISDLQGEIRGIKAWISKVREPVRKGD